MSTELPPELIARLAREPGFPADLADRPVSIDTLSAHWLAAPLDGPVSWAQACVYVIGEVPDWAWELITCALPRLTTPLEAVALSAGPLEDLLIAHPLAVIERLEDLAAGSARFRYVLSGVELPDSDDPAVIDAYERIARARAPAMADGLPVAGPLPPQP